MITLMIYLLAPLLAAILPSLIASMGGIAAAGLSRGAIKKQNEYNTPANQVRRLREAGLPLGALEGTAHAGNQSAQPDTSGIKEAGHSLGNYISTQTQLKQLDIMKEQERQIRAEADLKIAERDYLLSGFGQDGAQTNLTGSIKTRQGIERTTLEAGHIANKMNKIIQENTATKVGLENAKLSADIANTMISTEHGKEKVEGEKLENQIKNVLSQYQLKMSEQQFQKLLRENNILITEGDAKKLQLRIDQATEGATIYGRDMEAALKGLTYDRVAEEFKNYKEYQEFIDLVQKQIKRTPWESITNPSRTLEAMLSMAYTTVTGLSGQSSGLLNFIK